eukprot:424728-Pleurochrysis_carterae.AAC.2
MYTPNSPVLRTNVPPPSGPQGRGTRGKAGMANLGDGDAVIRIFTCMSHDTILCISEKGIAYALHAFQASNACGIHVTPT